MIHKIIDYRITNTATADAVAKASKSLVTVVLYGKFKKAYYILGRRVK